MGITGMSGCPKLRRLSRNAALLIMSWSISVYAETEKQKRKRGPDLKKTKRWGGEDERRRGEGGGRYLSAVWPLAAQNPG
jgi:hypothetical protein